MTEWDSKRRQEMIVLKKCIFIELGEVLYNLDFNCLKFEAIELEIRASLHRKNELISQAKRSNVL